jgi:Tic22-like family
MTQAEVEDWLEHIPVYAVTDSNGAGVVLKPENDTSVFYFFLNAMQANATLTQLKGANDELDLKVSAFSLGKIWFNLLQSDTEKEVMLKEPGSDDAETHPVKGVEYRLVPDTRDLLGARMLLTMSPEDGEKMKEAGSMTPEMAQAAIKKAMTECPKFKATYNEIPVFTIAQMRMQKKPADGEDPSEAITLLPMYFSLQNMVGTWQQFMKQAPADVQGTEPAINLMSLHELIEMMMKESEIDWRNVVLIPASPEGSPAAASAAAAADPEKAMAQMGGATLGDV